MSRRDNLLRRVAELPDALLAEVEQSVEDIVSWHAGVYELTDEERRAVERGQAAAERGEFVSDAELAAFLARHRE